MHFENTKKQFTEFVSFIVFQIVSSGEYTVFRKMFYLIRTHLLHNIFSNTLLV